MTTPTATPKYIYKILPSTPSPPLPLPEALPVSALDARDKFIHMSTSRQILGTLQNFFSRESHVFILRVPYDRVAQFVKWEDASGKEPDEEGGAWDCEEKAGYFPHIHGNGMRLGREETDQVGKWEKDDTWTTASWPFDEDIPQ
ncbi:hypothetical protein B0O99DRAFT_681631 [Bisporella sp. PMI_857]|nr:hypothetical protein B0O99DRAFT_681631 [Bisporella sp. PMI_857]